jgi:hypothetical protein
VIENWLTSTNERGYEIPFCQLLSSQGHRILHLSSHGPQEQGKDIITIAPDGVPCAYQLKGEKNINLQKWRAIRPEIEELIEIPIHHPSVRSDSLNHRAYLVNNGFLADTVRREIHDRNRVNKKRRLPKLNLILKDDLLKDFLSIHGRFLPVEPADFRRFLELYLADGSALLQEGQFCQFLLSVMPFEETTIKKLDLERAIASTLLLTGYVLSPYNERQNSVSIINGWVLLGAHILAIIEKTRLPQRHWRPTFDICTYAIERSFEGLIAEVLARNTYEEGDLPTDGVVYKARMTLILGYLAAFENYLHAKREHSRWTKDILHFILANKSNLTLWGESAAPLFYSIAWCLERWGKPLEAENLLLSLVHTITVLNSRRNRQRGLPDPYHSVEAVMQSELGLADDDTEGERFVGHSYILQSTIECLARRLRRQALARMWGEISRISYCEFLPEPIWATYFWYSKKGELKQRLPKKPESWQSLLDRAQSKNFSTTPDLLKQMPHFLPLFLLVYPHRVRPELVKLADFILTDGKT